MNDIELNRPNASPCACCGGIKNELHNPLMVVSGELDDSSEECVHLFCAKRDNRYGFCWCCGDSQIYFAEDLNNVDECSVHAGESILDYPSEDQESFIEYIRKNAG